jgi:hypothetical protein
VGIVERGRLVIACKVSEVLASVQGSREILIEVLGDATLAASLLRARPDIDNVRLDGRLVAVEFSGPTAAAASLLKSLVDAGVPVVGFAERRATLEQIFMKVAAFETA